LSAYSWADVVLTDEEYQQIETALETARSEITKLETALERSNQISESLENQITELRTTLQIQGETWTALSRSLETQRIDQALQAIKWVGIGFLAGNVTGGAWGVSIGIKLENNFP
jgi:predicted  nucleic acid-binding Zn-ribbon protein